MAKKKTYGTARAFTEGHLEVLGDQSEVSNPSPPAEDPKMLASYAKQRAYNAQPWSVRKGNQIHGEDPNMDFKTRLAQWETKKANQGNDRHGPGPKPVDLGRDRGGNWYKAFDQGGGGRGGQGGAPTGTMARDRIDQTRWTGVSDASAAEAQRTGEAPKTGRDGSPLSRTEQLRNDRIKNKTLTRREKADQYSAQQPLARNELQEGIQGNFGTLGNFFNKDD